MKIAILTPTFYEFSGIDRVVELQTQRLTKDGHRVTVIALDATIEVENATILIVGMPKSLFWQRIYRLFYFFNILKIIRTVKILRDFDVIYSHFYPMNILAIGAKFFYNKHYIYYNHGVSPAGTFQGLHEKIYIMAFRFLNNLTAKHADQVVSISRYLAEIFRKETGRDSEVRYNQIDEKRFHSGINGMPIRKKHHIGDDPLVLYIGRVSPHKGIDLLIQAFNLVLQERPNAKLMIVGRHTFPAYSEKLVRMSNSSVIFAGEISDNELPLYYAACNVYATASLWEGFDMPLVEAQACGKAVVAFNIGPHQELINNKGSLVPEKDTRAFADALIFTLERKKMDTL